MNPWNDPEVARQQRALVDEELQREEPPAHHAALADAVCATNCPGSILEIGCASGYGREILDRAGVPYRDFTGYDISEPALRIAGVRYPESAWVLEEAPEWGVRRADIVIDGCSLMHRVETWREDLAAMARASRRWVILHRLPVVEGGTYGKGPDAFETQGYDKTFPALRFDGADIRDALRVAGFEYVTGTVVDRKHGPVWTKTYARPRHFATYFDDNYSSRALAMWRSLQTHAVPAVMHALCYDQASYDKAKAAGMDAQLAESFIAGRPDLARDQLPGPERTRPEWMWSVGPAWIAAVMRTTGEPVTYVDADVRFFSSPEPLFAELGGAPAAIIPHGFAREAQGLPGPTVESHEAPFGRFNVGIVMFNDPTVAESWADDCKRWCYDRPETTNEPLPAVLRARDEAEATARELIARYNIDERPEELAQMLPSYPLAHVVRRFGDQHYLTTWPDQRSAVVIQHPGAQVAPWNIHTRALDLRNGVPYFGNRPLIAYHFSALRQQDDGGWMPSRPEYELNQRQCDILYREYILELEANP